MKALTASATIGLIALAFPGQAAAQDIKAGEALFERCVACHTVAKGDRHRVGPNLWGVFGTTAGQRENGYNFSTAMKNSDLIWNETTLSAYLENPDILVPGSRMRFAGMSKSDDRDDVIAYLRSVSE